ncbi:Zim17-type zinc finger protein [Striga asiatica]|uniref:Zim17-type zinc finger protein n=1 Tax=Striga asiatica TaxID=4170 RepID=A0A5A7PRF2_STRAF|nr:Zim17-type zinc finger protein [Striga asiatica]
MAARRVMSLLAAKISQNPLSRGNAKISQNPLSRELSRNFYPSPSSFACSYQLCTRDFSIGSKANTQPIENQPKPEIPSLNTSLCSENNQTTHVKLNVNSNLKVSERHDLAMLFTCKVCEARSLKTACRDSYEKGVVIARCDGCGNLHLIADRLGWFGEPGSVEDFLAARGEEFKKGSPSTMNITLEDLAGKKET